MSDSESNKENKGSSFQKLKGCDNYHLWARLIVIKLAGKGLKGVSTYIENPDIPEDNFDQRVRTEPKPAAGEAQTAWDKKYYKALSIILSSVHANIVGEFEAIDDPAKLLVKAKMLYGKDELVSEVDLREQLSNLKFDLHMAADVYFAKIQSILNRLAAMGVHLNNRTKISTVLATFKGKEFTTFKDAIMPQIKNETTYEEVVSRFKIFIRRKQEDSNIEVESSYYTHNSTASGRGRSGGNRGRGGGYRGGRFNSGNNNRNDNRDKEGGSEDKGNKKCYTCNKFGHMSPECPNKGERIAKLKERIKQLEEPTPKDKEKEAPKNGTKRGNDGSGDDAKDKKARTIC